LELPTEVLREILSYIPEQLVVGQTCKKFYEVSCSLGSFNLTIFERRPIFSFRGTTFSEIEENGMFRSIANTSRRVDDLSVSFCNRVVTFPILLQFSQNLTKNVKKLDVADYKMTLKNIMLLNPMPNLNSVTFKNVKCTNFSLPSNFRFNLHHLKTLTVVGCAENLLKVLNHLPDHILESLTIAHLIAKKDCKYLENQNTIKTVKLVRFDTNYLALEQLQLFSMEIDGISINMRRILERQRALVELKVNEATQTDILFIANNLINLRKLSVSCWGMNARLDLSAIENLENLESFSMATNSNQLNFRSIRSRSLQNLKVGEISRISDVQELATNCPNVKKLSIDTITFDNNAIFNACLVAFPKLENFESYSALTNRYIYPDILDLQSLTRLYISYFVESFDFSIFFQSCRNLEIFSTEERINWKILRCILGVPKLKALCLKFSPNADDKFIEMMQSYGQNLESFHVDAHSDCNLEQLREELKEQFPLFRKQPAYPGFQFLMRKTNKKEACCK
jgi:hypothetical protein